MASSAPKPQPHHHHHHLPTPFGATAAPPPTPSTQPNLSTESTTPDFLSHLLHRLPPALSLSLPTRRSSPLSSSSAISATATPPLISLADPTPSLHSSLLSASTQHGFFHLIHHPIPSDLPLSAESAAVSLFSLPHHQKQLLFPNNWPLGHEIEDDGDSAASPAAESFCLDSSCSDGSTNDPDLDRLREFTREMEKLGLKVLEELASAVGFENPARDGLHSLLWISGGTNKPGRVYPYVLGLHYQIRCQKQSLLSDSGWVSVSGQTESVLVTLGDIAQVWSNGKLKKVRGRPVPSLDDVNDNPHCIMMSLLITLPVDSTVSPLIPDLVENEEGGEHDSINNNREQRLFNSFSFEDYAWRVYHERVPLKDPLVRYRV
ncbi:hypothetical protein Salat_1088700 [Sesamum alatum]|uniref:Non-haem dioxygenase N-terminal domain-containing protein n=1 Tax=Sesamum alatum TaxID=300844 RepID=A0AAE2CT75_9LAMI|nr:hypothetical protein Salat_1088700 [Sesamum alatum]